MTFFSFINSRMMLLFLVFIPFLPLKASEIDPLVEKPGTLHEQSDSLYCEPVDMRIVSDDNYPISNDTFRVCVYDTVTFQAAYSGENIYRYRWSNGSSNPEFKFFTSGIGNDIQKIWLDLIDLQTGCVYSDTLVVVNFFGACVGEQETDINKVVRIFPNPAKDYLVVEYVPGNSLIRILIYNINGQLVLEESRSSDQTLSPQLLLDISFLPRGLYMVRSINGQTYHDHKMVIN